MIIVRFKGGFGNQLFQYAAGRALAERHGVRLGFDTRWYGSASSRNTTPRTFDLPHFAVGGSEASADELRPFFCSDSRRLAGRLARGFARALWRRRLWIDDSAGYASEFIRLPARTLIEGYFQHPNYFSSVATPLRKEFELKERLPNRIAEKAADLASTPTVCIQVRRADYVQNPAMARTHGVCSIEYYREAWRRMLELVPNALGIVASDDHAWAMEAFSEWANVSVIAPEWDGPDFMYRFQLMRSCRHFIIANSTWGWWAAWLGRHPDKKVMMPERWFRDDSMNRAATGLRLPGWQVC